MVSGSTGLGMAAGHGGGVVLVVVIMAADGFFQLIEKTGAAGMSALLALNAEKLACHFVVQAVAAAHLVENPHFFLAKNEVVVEALSGIRLPCGLGVDARQAVFHFVFLNDP